MRIRPALLLAASLSVAFPNMVAAGTHPSPDETTALPFHRVSPERTAPPQAPEATMPDEPVGPPRPLRPGTEYLIVTATPLVGEFERFAVWKTQLGVTASVRTLSSIRRLYPRAVDDAERVRLFIRDAHARGTRWVLLGGDTEVIPTRYVHSAVLSRDFESDYYFSCLDGTWDANGNGIFAEPRTATDPGDDPDLIPEVYVGRAPVRTPEEARLFVDKTMRYTDGASPSFVSTALIYAEVLIPYPWDGSAGFDIFDGARFAEELLPDLRSRGLQVTRLYQNYLEPSYAPGALPESRASVLDQLGGGHNLSIFIGHANESLMSVGGLPSFGTNDLLTVEDVLSLSNGDRLTNLYCSTVLTHAIGTSCIGEAFLRAPNGGAVTSVGSSAIGLVSHDVSFLREYFRLLFEEGVTAVGELAARHRLFAVTDAGFDGPSRDKVLSTLLLGDPQLRIRFAPGEPSMPRRAIQPEAAGASAFSLGAPSPSPARDRTSIALDIPSNRAGGAVDVAVFDLAGRRVRTLHDGPGAGRLSASWDLRDGSGRRVNEGIYFVRARFGGQEQVRRLFVVR